MFSPWERAKPARSHGFSPLEKFFCFLKTFFKNLLTNPRRCDRITLVPQERDETKKKWTISSAGMSIRLTCGRSQVQVLYRPPVNPQELYSFWGFLFRFVEGPPPCCCSGTVRGMGEAKGRSEAKRRTLRRHFKKEPWRFAPGLFCAYKVKGRRAVAGMWRGGFWTQKKTGYILIPNRLLYSTIFAYT